LAIRYAARWDSGGRFLLGRLRRSWLKSLRLCAFSFAALSEVNGMKRLLTYMLMAPLLSACALVVPEVSQDQSYGQECKLITRNMDLRFGFAPSTDLGTSGCGANCLMAPVITAAGSFIVSGSIVMANDTLHWLEYQGRCNLGRGGKLKGADGEEVDVITEPCLLECDVETGACACMVEPDPIL